MPSSLRDLLNTLPQTGSLTWIGLRSGRDELMLTPGSATLSETSGLLGDRFAARSTTRQVSLIQAEHLAVIASCLGIDTVAPELLRRNLVIEGLNLLALKNQNFTIGDVQLATTGLCHPCSKMEKSLGPGGYNAVRGHGGITARVIAGGVVTVGDSVQVV